MATSKRLVAPFTKNGATFNPGDEVIAITYNQGIAGIRRAKYLGYTESTSYYKQEVIKSVHIEWDDEVTESVYEGTTTPINWSTYNSAIDKIERIVRPIKKISHLQYNNIIPANATIDDLIKAI